VGFPRNFSTGKFHSGINIFLLGSQEFQSPHFVTFRQALELGGHVRKGETGFPVIKVGTWTKDAGEATPTPDPAEKHSEQRIFLKLYTVFNACQIEGIEFPPVPNLEELVAEMGATFLGARAGIIEDDFENSAAYLRGWLDVLRVKDHKTWIIKAAGDALRAADYILGL